VDEVRVLGFHDLLSLSAMGLAPEVRVLDGDAEPELVLLARKMRDRILVNTHV